VKITQNFKFNVIFSGNKRDNSNQITSEPLL